jgi:CRP-like cAMP-binding protein
MKAIKNQILFANVTNYSLMILCNYVEIKEYHYGDIIFSQDETPEFFYIMLEGECKTVFETVVLKDKKLYENQRPQFGALKNLKKSINS